MGEGSGSTPAAGRHSLREALLALVGAEVDDLAARVAGGGAATAPAEPGDPPGSRRVTYEDWSEATKVGSVPLVTATDADHVVTLCNWAAANGFQVRALGHSHNWSPFVVPGGTGDGPRVLLVDTSRLNGCGTEVVDGMMHATFGTGVTLEAATAFLEGPERPGPNDPAPGFTFLNMPTPGGLTLGGILAVGGHGTSVPGGPRTVPEPDLMGCLSNMVVAFTAVTTDPDDPTGRTYALRRFHRSDPDASAFLVHLGRAFLTDVTLAAVPNYYLRLTSLFPTVDDLLAAPGKPRKGPDLATLLDAHGRVEVIWFPYQPLAWVQCNTRTAKLGGTPVAGPYNYPWMNWIPREVSDLVREYLLADPAGRLEIAMTVEAAVAVENEAEKVRYGTARDLEIYLTDDTLRMTACGYVLQLPRVKVQAAVHSYYAKVQALLAEYKARTPAQYPVNGAVEIRCTTVDRQDDLGIPGARPPALSASHAVTSDPSLDTVLWVDVLTFPGTDGANEFLTDLEQWMIGTWAGSADGGRLRPEWSKGWAYTPAGPWTNADVYGKRVQAAYDAADDGLTFSWAMETLARYDGARIFTNSFLDKMFA